MFKLLPYTITDESATWLEAIIHGRDISITIHDAITTISSQGANEGEISLDPSELYTIHHIVKNHYENYEPTETEQGLIPIPDGYAEQ